MILLNVFISFTTIIDIPPIISLSQHLEQDCLLLIVNNESVFLRIPF